MSKPFIDKIGLSHLITVLKDIFSKKADLINGKVPKSQLPETVTSWNDLIERPFEERSNIIKWNIDNIDYADKITIKSTTSSVTLYKVHGGTLSEEDLIGGTITIDGIEKQLGEDIMVIPRTNFIISHPSSIDLMKYIVVLKDCNLSFPNPTLTATYATTGIYFAEGVTEIRSSKSYIKQIDPKFIPELDYVKTEEVEEQLSNKADLVNGKVPSEQLPEFEIPEMDYIPNSEKGVPNGVSTLDENGKVPSEQLPDNIGGGLSEVAWNDITGKPFGETGIKVEWDGTPTDASLDLTSTFGVIFYKVSETVPTIHNGGYGYGDYNNNYGVLIDDTYYCAVEGAEFSKQFDLWNVMTIDNISVDTTPIGGPGVISMAFPETGLYFVWNSSDSHVKYFVSADYGIKTLDNKFIPELNYLSKTEKGFARGVATLDYDAKVPIDQIPVDKITSATDWRKINEFTISNGGGQGAGYNVLWDSDASYIDTILIQGDSDGNSLNLKAAAVYITKKNKYGVVGSKAYFKVNDITLPNSLLTCIENDSYTYCSYTVKKECNRYKIEHLFQNSEYGDFMNHASSSTKLEYYTSFVVPDIQQLAIEFIPYTTQTDIYTFDLRVEVWGIDA